MKHLLIVTMMAATSGATAQVTFEHSYAGNWRMAMEKVENEGVKYIGVEASTKRVIMYNDDHSIWKTINTSIPSSANMYTLPYYASRTLFNTDNKIEFLVIYMDGSKFTAQLYNEDGTVLNTFSDCVWYEVKKAGNDWKLLTHVNNTPQHTEVYGLPGQFLGIQKPGDNRGDTELYPNPMSISATLTYTLPQGEQRGTINVYSTAGVNVRSYQVTNQYNDVIVHRNDLPAGMYYYSLTTVSGTGAAEKFLIQ